MENINDYFKAELKRAKLFCLLAVVFFGIVLLISGCTKDDHKLDVRILSHGQKVWIVWSEQRNATDIHGQHADTKDYWIVDSLSNESNSYAYSGVLNFYVCTCPSANNDTAVFRDYDLSLTKSNEPFIDKIMH